MTTTFTSELAGLGTAFLWAGSAIIWAQLGRRINPTAVSTVRLALAVVMLSVIHWALYGTFWPSGIPPKAMMVLAISGIAGAAIGDLFYFHGIALIGPRLCMTIAALAPIVAACMVWALPMNETMTWIEIAGMLLAIGGVVWVVAEKTGRTAWPTTPSTFRRGVIFSLLSVVGQAAGFVASRIGMNDCSATPVPPFSATLIRVGAACACCWGVLLVTGRARETAVAFHDRRLLAWMLLGVILGPVVGIWFAMIALQGVATGIASTLISLSPLVLIPMSWLVYREKPTIGRILATLVAIAGVALMMMKKS